MNPSDNRRRGVLVLSALLAAYAAVAFVFATSARPNIDEGMFLDAGRLVAEGHLPYRDFPFAQAPLLPYAFAAPPPWQGSPLLGGRLIAWAAGVLGMAGALWLARRVAGNFAALVTLLVTLATLPLLWAATTVRAQAVATPLLVLGVALWAARRPGAPPAILPPALLLVSTSLRLTNAAVFAVVFAESCWRARRTPVRVAQLVATIAGLALVLAIPALLAPAQAWFQVVTAQLTRGARFGFVESPGFAADLARTLAAYLDLLPDAGLLVVLALCVAGCAAGRGARPSLRDPPRDPGSAQLALATAGALSFAPQLALGNAFAEYLTPLWALLAPAVGIGVASELDQRGAGRALRGAIAALLVAYCALHFARASERWIGTGDSGFAAFHETSAALGALGGPGCTMLTLETEVAVEAGCRVVPGLEYSYFSYFAELPDEEARRLGVTNLAQLRERVASDPPDLIVLAPGHAHLLFGPHLGAPPDRPRPRTPGSVAALEFLGPLERDYDPLDGTGLAVSLHRAGEVDPVPLRVYVRRAGS
jgi:hypothetical protein